MSSPSDDNESRESSESLSIESAAESSRGHFNNQHHTKKRKDTSHASQSRVKRLKPSYSDSYRNFFNASLEELDFETSIAHLSFSPSQIGASLWSSQEKACLFHLIALKGRHNFPALSGAIRSKSKPEIRDYLDLLHHTAMEQEMYAMFGEHFDITAIEAATEVGPACEYALESTADALSALQHREDEKVERAKYGDRWLLTPSTARWVNACLRTGELGEQEVSRVMPAATLLKVKTLLKLSKHIFMNSSDPESNWRAYAERRKPPSIMHTAFSDIQALVISLTKRIVSSALFLAESRIRAETNRFATPKPAVRRQDVLCTLETLGLDANATATWCGVARKCNLKVYEDVRYRKAWGERFTYDEVEEALANTENRRGRYRSRTRSPTAHVDDDSELGSDSASDSQSSDESRLGDSDVIPSSEESSAESEGELPDLTQDHGAESERVKQELLQDTYMEIYDQRARHAEERRLWKVLGEDPGTKMDLAAIRLPERPLPPTKTDEDLVDWTDWIDYEAQWEAFDSPIPWEDFVASQKALRRRRRKGSRDKSPMSSQSSEEDELRGKSYEALPLAQSREFVVASDGEVNDGGIDTYLDEESEEL